MDYKDLRIKFCELSGRYDLINQNYTDNGADFFINAGQKMLDRLTSTGKMTGRNVQSIAAGTTVVKTVGLRTVKEVWAGNSSEGLIRLEKVSLSVLREYYGEQFSDLDQGTPAYYTPVVYRPYPDDVAAATWSGYYDISDLLLAGTHYTYNGILILPPPDETYYVSIVGLFYSPTLSATVSGTTWTQAKSYWTEEHPDLLLQAALFKLETFYRNTEGAKDWKAGLDLDLLGIDYDLAEEDSVDVTQMEG